MEPRDLLKVWAAPDNSKLTPKQWSIRLPIHVAAKICALCDLYPRKTKTEIIGDLLATALDQLAETLPDEPQGARRPVARQDGASSLHERFEQLTREHIEALDDVQPSKGKGLLHDE
jgi:hypothetical protein